MSCQFVVSYSGAQFDIEKFIESHPAGSAIIRPYKDRDITEAFNDVGHSKTALKILHKYQISNNTEHVNAEVKPNPSIVTKLVTKEDPYHIHKALGAFALCSFAYRYFYVLPMTGGLGFTGTYFDYFTLMAHWLLSSSSLIFHVLEKRIVERPLIIYQEYRLHAILFTSSAVVVSIFGIRGYQSKMALGGMLAGLRLLVDLTTRVFGTVGVTAVRNNNDGNYKYIRMFYSYYQICALGSLIIVDANLCDLGFNTLIAIQSSTFLMTLKRKSVIRWKSHMFWYSFALLLSYAVIWRTKGTLFFAYMAVVFSARVYNINKYVLWAVYAATAYSIAGTYDKALAIRI